MLTLQFNKSRSKNLPKALKLAKKFTGFKDNGNLNLGNVKTIDLYREFKKGSRSIRFLCRKDEESRFGIYGWDYPTWARIK